MQLFSFLRAHQQEALRIALSYYVTNGLSAALGLLIISLLVHLTLGEFAAAAASVGVVVCIPCDAPAPKHGKFWMLVPAALLGLPLFVSVQMLHASPILLGLLLVAAAFMAFLAGALGKRGLPLTVSIMFSVVFSMAVPDHTNSATNLATSLYFALGALGYLVWATFTNALLNPAYRVQFLADTLQALTQLMRTQARQFTPLSEPTGKGPFIGALMKKQAALADQLQGARDILLESPRTRRRQQLADMLMQVLEIRDHLLACELDVDTLKNANPDAPMLVQLQQVMLALAEEIEHLADDLLLRRKPRTFASLRETLAQLEWPRVEGQDLPDDAPSPARLARGLANRIGNINDECLRLVALARGDTEPDIELVRTHWQLFVSPTTWSWLPLLAIWRLNAPPLRHAIRAALAIAFAYVLSLALPWGTHDYWIFLTIVVVLRGSLAQTLERRNHRVAGTVLGCALAGGLLAAQLSPWAMLLLVTLAQAVAHGFALRRYLITAVAATVLGLLQLHMLNAGTSPGFDALERIADTLIGVAIAWGFSYILPSWERTQISGLVKRAMAAQARHTRVALGLWQLTAIDNEPELQWRLARREAYDSLSALVQATQRSLSEPRAVRPPLAALARLLAYSYHLLAQLTTVKTLLLKRRGRLSSEKVDLPMKQAKEAMIRVLTLSQPPPEPTRPNLIDAQEPIELQDPFEGDLSPWLLHRLELATQTAQQLRYHADQVMCKVEHKAAMTSPGKS